MMCLSFRQHIFSLFESDSRSEDGRIRGGRRKEAPDCVVAASQAHVGLGRSWDF
jgi:hypothetical protein